MRNSFKLLIILVVIGLAINAPAAAQAQQTIAQARAAADKALVNVQGIVNAAPGIFDKTRRKFYIQDETAGIAVYYSGGGLSGFAIGDKVAVRGKLDTFKGEREIAPAAPVDVVKVSSGASPTPITIKTGELGVKNQGMLLTLSGKVTGTRNGFMLNDGSGDAHIYVNPATGINAAVKIGEALQVTGIGSIYNADYELLPRTTADIVQGGSGLSSGPRERGEEPPKRTLDTDSHDDQIEIMAVYATTDEAKTDEQGEAIRLYNSGDSAVAMAGWTLTDNEGATKLDGLTIAPHQRLWLAKNATRFTAEFGAPPDAEYGACEKTVKCLEGTPPALDNQGDEVVLIGPGGGVVDALVYGDGYADETGWNGPAVQPYLFASYVPPAGQIFYRKLDQASCLPLPNSHEAADWAQDPADPVNGRHMLYPGWSLDQFCATAKGVDDATTTFLVAPDNSFAGLAAALDGAKSEIDLELYFLTNPAIIDHITVAQDHGVVVRALFDGDVSGGEPFKLPHATANSYAQTYWAAQQITVHGGRSFFWAANTAIDLPIPHRYNNDHQKFVIIDHKTAVISSGNFAQSAFPYTGSASSTKGNRDAVVITDSPTVVKRLDAIFAQDADPNRSDIQAWDAGGKSFARPPDEAARGYTPVQPAPLTIHGPTSFEVVQSPETALRTVDGLIGMVAKAGKGDRVLVEQQYEELDWGSSPNYLNPRLEAYIAAARRGATVQIILDGVNSEATNAPTVAAIRKIAQEEHITIDARITPKTGTSGNAFHIKMVLVTSGADGYVHIGSINGSENSSRYNREVAVQVQSRQAFDYYAKVFDADWRVSAK